MLATIALGLTFLYVLVHAFEWVILQMASAAAWAEGVWWRFQMRRQVQRVIADAQRQGRSRTSR